MTKALNYQDIINFWFKEIEPKQHWVKDPEFDDLIKKRFGDLLISASQCELFAWRASAQGRLAEIIVLDQFSRNIYRDTAQAFAQDPLALALAQEAVSLGADKELLEKEIPFLYMPYMHSESKIVHVEAERLFKQTGNYEFELKHKAIVDRFGRYPHRNEILERESTEDEVEFLKGPGSSF
jgi:uncharacterized protein (DUF924 family)